MKKKILVLMGGISGERSISFMTGKACCKALKKKGLISALKIPNKNSARRYRICIINFRRLFELKKEKPMFNETMQNAESMFESDLFIEDFLPVISVVTFGYIVSCLAFLFLN